MRIRFLGAVGLLLALICLVWLVPDVFAVVVGVALLSCLSVNWVALEILRQLQRRHPESRAIRTDAYAKMFLALGSTDAAILGALSLARVLGWIGPMPPQVWAVGVSYALLMISAPAIDSLIAWRPLLDSDATG